LSAHKLVLLTLALMCTCPLGKTPIFPHMEWLTYLSTQIAWKDAEVD
jgi:hypothetical protein